MNQALTQKKVIVIGGSSGMGLATAQALAAAGAEVVIASRHQQKLDAALGVIEGNARARALDFTQRSDVDAFFASEENVDHLVLMGAGMPAWGEFAEVEASALESAFQSKFWGYFHCAQAAAPRVRSGGSMLFTIGAAARCAIPGTSGVAAVNGAIRSMALTLARELAPLRVNVLSPGLVDTPAYDWMSEADKAAFYQQMGGELPVGRVGTAQEIAQAAMYLVGNSFTTGAVLDVDGGGQLR